MRILIAEDEARIARFMERGLKANGFASTVVEDGISALDLASSGDFDLLILDVGLPRMDGFQVLRSTWKPSIRGRPTSRMSRSKSPLEARSRAEMPSSTTVEAKPFAFRPRSMKRAMRASSSAMRILIRRSSCGQCGHRCRRVQDPAPQYRPPRSGRWDRAPPDAPDRPTGTA